MDSHVTAHKSQARPVVTRRHMHLGVKPVGTLEIPALTLCDVGQRMRVCLVSQLSPTFPGSRPRSVWGPRGKSEPRHPLSDVARTVPCHNPDEPGPWFAAESRRRNANCAPVVVP